MSKNLIEENNATKAILKYEAWKKQQSIQIAYDSLPKSVIKYNSDMKNGTLTIDQMKSYIAEITQR